jgi:hypothetical protein
MLQVTSVHVDRHKVITATSATGPAPVCVWSTETGALTNTFLGAEEKEELQQQGRRGEGAGGSDEDQTEVGVTALAASGAVLVTGNAGGTVVERDFSRGGPPARQLMGDAAMQHKMKFWSLAQ